jgi:hypothetical protein
MIEEDKTVEAKKIDVSSLSNLFPNPKPSESTATCGYCVGRSLMAYLDGITAAMADVVFASTEMAAGSNSAPRTC